MLTFNSLCFLSPGYVIEYNSTKKPCPIVNEVCQPDLHPHPLGQAILFNWITADAIFEDVVVHLVHYLVEVVQVFVAIGISVRHCSLPAGWIAVGFVIIGGYVIEFRSSFGLESFVSQA